MYHLFDSERILSEVKRQLHIPLLTDVHELDEINQVADVVDVLQTPAFLCRQTNFIKAVAKTGRAVNIKKGQFLAFRPKVKWFHPPLIKKPLEISVQINFECLVFC